MKAVTVLLVAGALSACLLPLSHGNGQCLPNSVLTAKVRATVYRTGPGDLRVPDVCSDGYEEFRAELLKLALANFELDEECSLLSYEECECERRG